MLVIVVIFICRFHLTNSFRSELKPKFRRFEKELFTRLNMLNRVGVLTDLGAEHFPGLLKATCAAINLDEFNMIAWKRDGIIPFTEDVFWDALERELRIEQLSLNSTPSGDQPTSSRQAVHNSSDAKEEGFRVDVGVGIDVDVPNPTEPRRAALAKAIRQFQGHDEFLRKARASVEDPENAQNALNPILHKTLGLYDNMSIVVTDFVKKTRERSLLPMWRSFPVGRRATPRWRERSSG